jgi:hypothetical protein
MLSLTTSTLADWLSLALFRLDRRVYVRQNPDVRGRQEGPEFDRLPHLYPTMIKQKWEKRDVEPGPQLAKAVDHSNPKNKIFV